VHKYRYYWGRTLTWARHKRLHKYGFLRMPLGSVKLYNRCKYHLYIVRNKDEG